MGSEPLNPLEEAVVAGRRGDLPLEDLLGILLTSSVVVPSAREVGEEYAGFVPVIFDRDGTPMLAVFTEPSRASGVAHLARFAISFTVADLVTRMPVDHGVVLNPGHELGLELLPDAVAALRRTVAEQAGRV